MNVGEAGLQARVKLNTIKVQANNQEGDDNPCQSKGEHVAHVMSCDAPSRFSRGSDCRDILVIGHPCNPMGIDIGVAALDTLAPTRPSLARFTGANDNHFSVRLRSLLSQDACIAPRRLSLAKEQAQRQYVAAKRKRRPRTCEAATFSENRYVY